MLVQRSGCCSAVFRAKASPFGSAGNRSAGSRTPRDRPCRRRMTTGRPPRCPEPVHRLGHVLGVGTVVVGPVSQILVAIRHQSRGNIWSSGAWSSPGSCPPGRAAPVGRTSLASIMGLLPCLSCSSLDVSRISRMGSSSERTAFDRSAVWPMSPGRRPRRSPPCTSRSIDSKRVDASSKGFGPRRLSDQDARSRRFGRTSEPTRCRTRG